MPKYKKAKNWKVARPLCHVSPKHVLTLGNAEIYGGNATEVMKRARQFDLIVQAADLSYTQSGPMEIPLMEMNDAARKTLPPSMVQMTPPTAHVKLDWPDFQLPFVAMEWWDDFTDWLLTGETPRKVAVACGGGHGRTGTMLAILAGLGGVTTGDPVEYIRSLYCQNAVESGEQLDYIAEVTGLEVRSKVSGPIFQDVPGMNETDQAYLPSWATLQAPEGHDPETH